MHVMLSVPNTKSSRLEFSLLIYLFIYLFTYLLVYQCPMFYMYIPFLIDISNVFVTNLMYLQNMCYA